jgi:hypothetical protein
MFSWVSASALFWLKTISFCITSLLALLGLLYDFKNKASGNLTRWGRVNLCGLIVAFIVGIASQKIEDDRKQVSDEKSATDMKTLVERSQTLVAGNTRALADLKTVTEDNGQLIVTTQKSLTAAEKSDEDTLLTLKNIARNQELVGPTIEVHYLFKISLSDAHYGSDLHVLIEKIKDFKKRNNIDRSGLAQDTEIEQNIFGRVEIRFGRHSPIIPSGIGNLSGIMMRGVPFQIYFSKTPIPPTGKLIPMLSPNGKKERVAMPVYLWDDAATSLRSPNLSDGQILETPLMRFFETETNVFQSSPEGPAVFRLRSDPGNYLSASDFGGSYMAIRISPELPVKFCELSVQIGPKLIKVPLNELAEDEYGGFNFRLPQTMTQSFIRSRDIQMANNNRCPDFFMKNSNKDHREIATVFLMNTRRRKVSMKSSSKTQSRSSAARLWMARALRMKSPMKPYSGASALPPDVHKHPERSVTLSNDSFTLRGRTYQEWVRDEAEKGNLAAAAQFRGLRYQDHRNSAKLDTVEFGCHT